jgi:hypothetical protein
MTAIPATNNELTSGAEAAGIKDSIASVVSRLTGTPITGDELGNHALSEDLLYAAQVHKQLARENSALADKMIDQVKGIYDRKFSKKQSQPLFRAVDTFLQKAVSRGDLKKNKMQTISQEAFGKAQIDHRADRLNRNPGAIKTDRADESLQRNVHAVIARMESNSGATRKQMKAFRDRIDNRGKLSDKRMDKTRSLFDKIFPEASEKLNEDMSTSEGDGSIINTDPVDYNKIETNRNELAYRPVGPNGGVQLIAPEILSAELSTVKLISRETGESIELTQKGSMDDGRRVFESDIAGTTLTRDVYAVFGYIDGTEAEIPIGQADAFARHPYREVSEQI